MIDPKSELLQVVESYESAARLMTAAGSNTASYFSALRPTLESTLSCVRRLVNVVRVSSRSELERFRQVVSQARAYVRRALAEMNEHATLCVYDLLRGVKHLLQDLIHNRLVDEDRVLSLERSDLVAILGHLKFPPRKGSKLRAALDAVA